MGNKDVCHMPEQTGMEKFPGDRYIPPFLLP